MKKILRTLARPFLSRSQWRSLARPFAWCVVSAVVLRFAFPKFELGWLAWFGLAPFLVQLYGRPVKEGAWLTLVFGVVFFYLNLTWLNTIRIFNPFAPVGVLAGAFVCVGYLMVFGVLSAIALRRLGPLARLLFVPSLWVAVEVWRSWGEIGFPWIYLGHTQVGYLPMIQIADLAGAYGVSFVIVLVNMALAETWRSISLRSRSRGVLVVQWCMTLSLVAFTLGYGVWRLRQGERLAAAQRAEKPFRLAVIQPEVTQTKKLESYAAEDPDVQMRLQTSMNVDLDTILRKLKSDLAASHAAPLDLIVLPESALTNSFFNLMRNPDLVGMVRGWATNLGAPVFLGANRYVLPKGKWSEENPGEMYNSAFLIKPGDTGANLYYDKIHLVPFGEYASYLGYIPGMRKILAIGDFNMGDSYPLFSVGKRTFGCVICFESCFPYLFRPYDRQNADFMTIVTNDAWYGLSSGPRRHQMQAIFRAIEMRRPVVRAANTGISCVVDPWGRVTSSLPLREGEAEYLVASLPLRPEVMRDTHTIYMRSWGEWFAALCFAYCAAGLFVARHRVRREMAMTTKPDARRKVKKSK